jgi:hypothetical protein
MKLLTTAEALSKHIDKIGKDSKTLESAVQMALASATFFAVKDGNVEPINRLLLTVGKGLRRTALWSWLETYAPVLPQADKDKAKEAPYVFSRDKLQDLTGHAKPTAEQAEEHAKAIMAHAWTEFKPEPEVPATFDVAALVQGVIKKAKGLQQKGSKAVNAELLSKLETLLPSTAPASL